MWKILTAPIREEIFYLEDQQVCCKETEEEITYYVSSSASAKRLKIWKNVTMDFD